MAVDTESHNIQEDRDPQDLALVLAEFEEGKNELARVTLSTPTSDRATCGQAQKSGGNREGEREK